MATSDQNGNLILWRINTGFKILCEISNFSESNVTNLLWSPNGQFLFACNSNGSVYAVEFNDFFRNPIPGNKNELHLQNVTNLQNLHHLQNLNNINNHSLNSEFFSKQRESIVSGKRKIEPTMINNNSGLSRQLSQQSQINQNLPVSNISPNGHINCVLPGAGIMPTSYLNECQRCQKQKLDQLENKIICLKLDSFENLNVYMLWENKIYENHSTVQLHYKNNLVLFSNKFENKLIRILACNNFFYAFYDSNSIISVYSLFNNMVKIILFKYFFNYFRYLIIFS